MKRQLKIALVAHDTRKADMVEWAVFNSHMLSQHKLICTGTTGGLILEAFEREGLEVDVDRKNNPHEADIQMLLRQCRTHNVPIACNRYSADLIITSPLWDDAEYVPKDPQYIPFHRE